MGARPIALRTARATKPAEGIAAERRFMIVIDLSKFASNDGNWHGAIGRLKRAAGRSEGSDPCLSPANHRIRDSNGLGIFLLGNGLRYVRIASCRGIWVEPLGFPDCFWNRLARVLEQRQQEAHVVHVGKLNAARNQQGLDGLFRSLLSIEAEIFEVHGRETIRRPSQIAAGAIQPLPRVVGWVTLRRLRRPPFPPARRV